MGQADPLQRERVPVARKIAEQSIIAAAEWSKYSISALQRITQELRKKENLNDRRTTNQKNII